MNRDLEVGQRWYGLRPGAYAVIEVYIDELTEYTVLIREERIVFNGWTIVSVGSSERYRRGEFNFIELLPPKEPYVPPSIVESSKPEAEVSKPRRQSLWERIKGMFG